MGPSSDVADVWQMEGGGLIPTEEMAYINSSGLFPGLVTQQRLTHQTHCEACMSHGNTQKFAQAPEISFIPAGN